MQNIANVRPNQNRGRTWCCVIQARLTQVDGRRTIISTDADDRLPRAKPYYSSGREQMRKKNRVESSRRRCRRHAEKGFTRGKRKINFFFLPPNDRTGCGVVVVVVCRRAKGMWIFMRSQWESRTRRGLTAYRGRGGGVISDGVRGRAQERPAPPPPFNVIYQPASGRTEGTTP